MEKSFDPISRAAVLDMIDRVHLPAWRGQGGDLAKAIVRALTAVRTGVAEIPAINPPDVIDAVLVEGIWQERPTR